MKVSIFSEDEQIGVKLIKGGPRNTKSNGFLGATGKNTRFSAIRYFLILGNGVFMLLYAMSDIKTVRYTVLHIFSIENLTWMMSESDD